MNPDLINAVSAAQTHHLDALAWPAILQPKGGEPIDCGPVGATELPDGLVQARYGADYGRVCDATVQVAALRGYVPGKNDEVIWESGCQAGVWKVLGTERQDDAVIILRVRRTDRHDGAAAGIRQVRR